jgi:hypothetical protein
VNARPRLKDHILGAVALLQAAKSGDQTAIAQGERRLVRQRQPDRRLPPRRQSPRLVPHDDAGDDEDASRPDPRRGAASPRGDFAADVRDYDAVHRHILEMADTLSDGIIRHFPKRFR